MHFHHCAFWGADFNRSTGLSEKFVYSENFHRRNYIKEQPWGGDLQCLVVGLAISALWFVFAPLFVSCPVIFSLVFILVGFIQMHIHTHTCCCVFVLENIRSTKCSSRQGQNFVKTRSAHHLTETSVTGSLEDDMC